MAAGRRAGLQCGELFLESEPVGGVLFDLLTKRLRDCPLLPQLALPILRALLSYKIHLERLALAVRAVRKQQVLESLPRCGHVVVLADLRRLDSKVAVGANLLPAAARPVQPGGEGQAADGTFFKVQGARRRVRVGRTSRCVQSLFERSQPAVKHKVLHPGVNIAAHVEVASRLEVQFALVGVGAARDAAHSLGYGEGFRDPAVQEPARDESDGKQPSARLSYRSNALDELATATDDASVKGNLRRARLSN
mmetsp:Transcript_2196/g.6041  ORF Transcript_2196/g.6041 Transcript_2196/m.6041 type:complete len:251 (+) Transcript_2196:711-1463(+)